MNGYRDDGRAIAQAHGRKEPPHVQGQGQQPRVPDCDGAAMAERSYPGSEVRGGGQEELSHAPTPEARGGGRKEQPTPEARGGRR